MMKPFVIGIMGKKRSGKDTLADVVCDHMGTARCHKYNLATPIKDACRILFHMSDSQLYDHDSKETPDPRWGGSTPRQLFQWLGTDIFRNQLDRDFWLKHAKMYIEQSNYDTILIPDIRFKNEMDFIRSFPRNCIIHVKRNDKSIRDQHESETFVDEVPSDSVDFIIVNNGDLSDYKKNIMNHFEMIMNGV